MLVVFQNITCAQEPLILLAFKIFKHKKYQFYKGFHTWKPFFRPFMRLKCNHGTPRVTDYHLRSQTIDFTDF
jgi:hypothetical protein